MVIGSPHFFQPGSHVRKGCYTTRSLGDVPTITMGLLTTYPLRPGKWELTYSLPVGGTFQWMIFRDPFGGDMLYIYIWVFPKIMGKPPNHPLKNRLFHQKTFTIHFGGNFSPYFWFNIHIYRSLLLSNILKQQVPCRF